MKKLIQKSFKLILILTFISCSSDDDTPKEEPEVEMGYFPVEITVKTESTEYSWYLTYNNDNTLSKVLLEYGGVDKLRLYYNDNKMISKAETGGREYLYKYSQNGILASEENENETIEITYYPDSNRYEAEDFSMTFNEDNVFESRNLNENVEVKTNPGRNGCFKNLDFQPVLYYLIGAIRDFYYFSPVEVTSVSETNRTFSAYSTYNSNELPESVVYINQESGEVISYEYTYEEREL